jgi:hypothetical protein
MMRRESYDYTSGGPIQVAEVNNNNPSHVFELCPRWYLISSYSSSRADPLTAYRKFFLKDTTTLEIAMAWQDPASMLVGLQV